MQESYNHEPSNNLCGHPSEHTLNCQGHTHDHHSEAHANDHPHVHDHHGDHETSTPKEELLALLSYMVSHNKHHAQELSELATCLDGDAKEALSRAIQLFSEGNEQLEVALDCMKRADQG